MGLFDDILAEYGAPQTSISPVGQSLARGLMPQIGAAPPMTRAVPEAFQVMTPVEGPMMTPASFTELPAEQQSALTLESMMRQRTQRDILKAEEERIRRNDAIAAFGLNLGDAAALGFGTEIASALEAPLSEKKYGDIIREYGTAKERLFETNPVASIAGGVTGAILPTVLTGVPSPLGGASPITSAALAGRTAPTLAERLILGRSGADMARAVAASRGLQSTVTSGEALAGAIGTGALQGAVQGVGGAEPTTDMSTEEALLRRGISGGIGGGVGLLAPALVAGTGATARAALSPKQTAKKATEAAREFFMPVTANEADVAAGNIFRAVGVSPEGLEAAKQAASTSSNPLARQLTSAELLQNSELAKLEKVATQGSGVGRQTFWDKEKQQLSRAGLMLRNSVDDIDTSGPENALQLQKEAQAFIADRAIKLSEQGNAMYSALPDNVQYKRLDLQDKIKKIYEEKFPAAKGTVERDIQYAFDFLTKPQIQEGALGRRIFAAGKPSPTITGKELISLRSGLLEAGRNLAKDNPTQAKLANDLGETISEFIKTDSQFGPKFAEANKFWDEYVNTFQTGPLSSISDPQIVSPDKFHQKVFSDVRAWQQFQKQTGLSPKVVKEQLSMKFDEFNRVGAGQENLAKVVDDKLKWIDDNLKFLADSPIEGDLGTTFTKAKESLSFIKEMLQQKKNVSDFVAPGFNIKNLEDFGLNDLAAIAVTANPNPRGATLGAMKAAMRQFTRDKLRQALSRTAGGALLGLGAGYGYTGGVDPTTVAVSGLAAGIAAGGGFVINRMGQSAANSLNEALVAGLRDPDAMSRMIGAAIQDEAKTTASKAGGLLTNASTGATGRVLSKLVGQGAAVAGKTATDKMTGSGESTTPKKKETKPVGKFDDILAEYGTTPAPTPQPEKRASLLEKAGNVLVPPVQAEETKKSPSKGTRVTIPVGDKYVEPSLLRAIIKVESNYKANARSKAGALGPMQLMPRTAKALGVDPNDVHQNIEGGSRYMQQLINRFNDTNLGLMAYNWGEGNVAKALRWLQGRSKPATFNNIIRYSNSMPFKVPRESREYVYKINTAWDYYKSRG